MLVFARRTKIFEKVRRLSTMVAEASRMLDGIARDWRRLEEGAGALKKIEAEADELVHRIKDDIEKTFVLPLDKEDIGEFTERLDDVVDNIEETANRLQIYGISESTDALRAFTVFILEAAAEIEKNAELIEKHRIAGDAFAASIKRLRDLEADGDKLHRTVLRDLMNGSGQGVDGGDFLSVLKWKEIYQTLEDTLDTCDDIAKLFSKLRMKYV